MQVRNIGTNYGQFRLGMVTRAMGYSETYSVAFTLLLWEGCLVASFQAFYLSWLLWMSFHSCLTHSSGPIHYSHKHQGVELVYGI